MTVEVVDNPKENSLSILPMPNRERMDFMNRFWIRTLVLTLCLCLCFGSGLADVLTAAPEEYSLPLTDEPITLSYMTCESWTPEYALADNREIWQQIEKDTGVKIEWNVVSGSDYTTVLKTRIAGGDLPDIFWLDASANPIQLYEDGLTINHGEYVSKYAPNVVKLYNELPDLYAALVGSDGELYAAGSYVYVGVESVKGMFYRRDWLKNLGLDEPETLEDYYNMFYAFANNDPNGNGLKDEVALAVKKGGNASVLNEFAPLGTAFGLSLHADNGLQVDENGKVTYDFVKPELKEFLAYLKRYYDAGILPAEVTIQNDSVQKTLLSDNRLGAYFNGVGQCDTYDKILLQAGFIDEITEDKGFGLLVPPKAADGVSYWAPVSYLQGNMKLVISADCEHPEIAMKWIDYVWGSQAGSRYTTMGIEGKTYNVAEDGTLVFTDYILNHPDGIGVHPALRTVGAFTPYIARWTPEAWTAQWASNPKAYNQIKTASALAMKEPFPQMLGTPDEMSRIASIKADMETYRDEMILKFIMGQEDLENFDKYVDTLYQMGLQEMLDIYQAQYDALKK